MIKAVVFDMDGVLFDTEKLHIQSCFEAAEQMGLTLLSEAAYGTLGRNARDQRELVLRLMEEHYPNAAFPYDMYVKRHDEILFQKLETSLSVMKGVRELLEFLRQQEIKTAVASSTPYDRICSYLKRTGLEEYFQTIIAGNMVEHSKPDPDIYLKACSALGVPPTEAMAIEDSPNGLKSAHAAGMITVMVPDLIDPTSEIRALCDHIFESLLAVRDYLEAELCGR